MRQAPAETPRLDTGRFEGGKQVNPDLRSLIALQDIELKIASLQRQISDIPKQIEACRQELQHLEQAHQSRVTQLQEDTKHRRAFEGEVDLMRARLSKLKDQLMLVKTNKEYTAMLHEIQMAEAKIRQEEDRILEIMEEMEDLEAGLRNDEKELKARTQEIQKSVQACESSIPELEAALGSLREERARTETTIESGLLSRFRRIAELRKGIALAEARDELCTACHVRIRPQVYAELQGTEDIHSCDSCSRILYLKES